MPKYNIELNEYNFGLSCFFTHNGKDYFADLCVVDCLGTECMIFPAKGREVPSYTELYCKRGMPVTEEELVKCIEEFVKETP